MKIRSVSVAVVAAAGLVLVGCEEKKTTPPVTNPPAATGTPKPPPAPTSAPAPTAPSGTTGH